LGSDAGVALEGSGCADAARFISVGEMSMAETFANFSDEKPSVHLSSSS
jgi:hypothetical protein